MSIGSDTQLKSGASSSSPMVDQFLRLEFVRSYMETRKDGTPQRVEIRRNPETGQTLKCTFPMTTNRMQPRRMTRE